MTEQNTDNEIDHDASPQAGRVRVYKPVGRYHPLMDAFAALGFDSFNVMLTRKDGQRLFLTAFLDADGEGNGGVEMMMDREAVPVFEEAVAGAKAVRTVRSELRKALRPSGRKAARHRENAPG